MKPGLNFFPKSCELFSTQNDDLVVNPICCNMFPAEVNSNLSSQLIEKTYRGLDSVGPIHNSIVYILGENTITGLGVCTRSATIFVHRNVIEDKDMVKIYIREKHQRAYAQVKKKDGMFALMLVRRIIYNKTFRYAMKSTILKRILKNIIYTVTRLLINIRCKMCRLCSVGSYFLS